MLKLIRFAFLSAALLCICSSTLSAQEIYGHWTASDTLGGGRATAVARGTISDGYKNDGWREKFISYLNPLIVEANLSGKASGTAATYLTATGTYWNQNLNTFSTVGRSIFRGFHRARVVGMSDATWTYQGPRSGWLERFDISLRLRGDIGTDPILQLIDDVMYPDVALADDEVGILMSMVTMDIPDVGVITGILIGEANFWIGPPGAFVISADGTTATVSNVIIESGEEVVVTMDSDSDLLLRPGFGFGRLRSLIRAEFNITRPRNPGPPIR